MVTVDDARFRVVQKDGADGYVVRWTAACSGCSDDRENVSCNVGSGCSECGYTGKCRNSFWTPLDPCGDCGGPKTRHASWCGHVAREQWPHPPKTPVWARVEDVEVATVTKTHAHFAGDAVIVFIDIPNPSFLRVDRVRLREVSP